MADSDSRTFCTCETCSMINRHPHPPTPPSSLMDEPTRKVRWSRFDNRSPSSVTSLWPPYDFSSSSSSGEDRRGFSGSEWATIVSGSSDWATVVSEGARQSAVAEAPESAAPKRESQTTKSLRRFVEKEIGLGAIHTGRSDEDLVPGPALDRHAWEGEWFGSGRRRPVGLYRGVHHPSMYGEVVSGAPEGSGKRALCSKAWKRVQVEMIVAYGCLKERLKSVAQETGHNVRKLRRRLQKLQ